MKLRNKESELIFSNISGFFSDDSFTVKDKAYFICNLDYDRLGKLVGRKKLRKLVDLPLAHSPFGLGDGLYLVCSCQDNDKLYLFNRNTLELRLLIDLPTVYARYWYVKYRGKVYISNRYWNGILELGSYSVREWRVDKVDLKHIFEGSDYFFADVEPMPKVSYLSFLAGRILGVRDNVVYYTEALYPDIYRSVNRIVFPEMVNKLLVNDVERSLIILLESKVVVGKLADAERFIFEFTYFDKDVKGGVLVGESKKEPLFLAENGLVSFSGLGVGFVGRNIFRFDDGVVDVEGKVGRKRFYAPSGVSFGDAIIVDVIKKSQG